jgi:hypothetical protein
VCSSPQLIAAYHVLLRLLEPRHPPCALICFKTIQIFESLTSVLMIWKDHKLLGITTFSQYVKELLSLVSSRLPRSLASGRPQPDKCRCVGLEPFDPPALQLWITSLA